ncbi:MAG: response regulator [Deltaproteobacteria bacterium]|nr:response regulator [Deltaproteobacteria bacterium]
MKKRTMHGKKVLIVEDHSECRDLLARCFRYMYFEPIEAGSGGEAITKAILEFPEAILLDLSLPDMTGIDLIKALKSNIKTVGIPIIVNTGRTDKMTETKALQAGADAYFTKPAALLDLTKTIEKLLIRPDTYLQ